MERLYHLQNLKKTYGKQTVLHMKELTIHEGETTVIMGPNGAGKSTLLRILSLIEDMTTGRLFLKDQEAAYPLSGEKNLTWRKQMATIWQRPYLFQTTVLNNIALGLRFRGMAEQEMKEKVEEISRELSIHHLLEKRGPKISGGERQRVSIARAFVLKPEILFMDEVLLNLDREGGQLVKNLIWREKKRGTTIILVTHNLHEASSLGDRFLYMERGEILQDTPSAERLHQRGMRLDHASS